MRKRLIHFSTALWSTAGVGSQPLCTATGIDLDTMPVPWPSYSDNVQPVSAESNFVDISLGPLSSKPNRSQHPHPRHPTGLWDPLKQCFPRSKRLSWPSRDHSRLQPTMEVEIEPLCPSETFVSV